MSDRDMLTERGDPGYEDVVAGRATPEGGWIEPEVEEAEGKAKEDEAGEAGKKEGGDGDRGILSAERYIDEVTAKINDPKLRVTVLRSKLGQYIDQNDLDAVSRIDEEIKRLESEEKTSIDWGEARKEFDKIITATYSELDDRENALKRWSIKYKKEGIPDDLREDLVKKTETSLEKISEVDVKDKDRERYQKNIRMAMIAALEVSKAGEAPSIQSFGTFIQERARTLGSYGKTHFEKKFQDPLESEYNARAELAKVLAYWEGKPDPDEASLKSCPVLSRSTYNWLAEEDKTTTYNTESEIGEGGELKEKAELRKEMDILATEIYTRMLMGGVSGIDTWNTTGQDRLDKIDKLAEELKVSRDSVRLTWQVAVAECWQARMGVGFVSHKAGKLVKFAEYRDFHSRKADITVPGGIRKWGEYLQKSKNIYPPEGSEIYKLEGSRLARVGFEAWSIKMGKGGGGFRKGQVWLFSEKGDHLALVTDPLLFSKDDDDEIENKITKMTKPDEMDDKKKIDEKERLKIQLEAALGGEKALLAGKYFTKMQAFLAQPAIADIDLPQTVMKDDMIKAAGVMKTIEAFGEIDATKASRSGLGTLRKGLVSIFFRFQSNDLVLRKEDEDGEDYGKRLVNVGGKEKFWNIDSQTQERFAKARIRVGELMEEWAKSYVWLLSWANPALEDESKVVGMRNWINLARDVARDYDESHQWGEYVGYGYGNYDENELAVEAGGELVQKKDRDGKPLKVEGKDMFEVKLVSREGATEESKAAVKRYTKWFDGMFKVNKDYVVNTRRAMTMKRRLDDMEELGAYYPVFFWGNRWW